LGKLNALEEVLTANQPGRGDIGGSLRGPAAFSGIWTMSELYAILVQLNLTMTRIKQLSFAQSRSNSLHFVRTNQPLDAATDGHIVETKLSSRQTAQCAEAFAMSNCSIVFSWTPSPGYWSHPLSACLGICIKTGNGLGRTARSEWASTPVGLKLLSSFSSQQTDDGYVRPVPPMYRAIQAVREALEKDDRFEVVDYTPYKTQECVDLAVRFHPVLDDSLTFPNSTPCTSLMAASQSEQQPLNLANPSFP
jgi:hypothetical protein